MIDPARTRDELLALVVDPEHVEWTTLRDPTDGRLLSRPHVRLRVEGPSRDDLFPLLNLALCERLAPLPRAVCVRDVLAPLKNGLGNAYKRGHGRDRSRTIRVEVIATPRGVFVAVADEGPGFDVDEALDRARRVQPTAGDRGLGFRTFERSGAWVGFENGGRTLMICRPLGPDEPSLPQGGGRDPASDADTWARGLVRALEETGRAVTSCRAYGDRRDGAWSVRFAVRLAGSDRTSIYSGRLFASEEDAAAEVRVAREVADQLRSKKLRVAQPVARLDEEPRLVVYDFDPWLDLAEYLRERSDAAILERSARRVGLTLRALHDSPLRLESTPWEQDRERLTETGSSWIETTSGGASGEAALRAWQACVGGLAEIPDAQPVPSHGALRGSHIHYGVNGRFYLSHWERAGLRHPGVDVAGFVADLLTFARESGEAAAFDVGLETFAQAYFGGLPASTWWDHLPALVAAELVSRSAQAGSSDTGALALIEEAGRMRVPGRP